MKGLSLVSHQECRTQLMLDPGRQIALPGKERESISTLSSGGLVRKPCFVSLFNFYFRNYPEKSKVQSLRTVLYEFKAAGS